MTKISVTVSGSSAVVCVETEGAAMVKLILRDATERRYVRECKICLTCCLKIAIDIFLLS